MRTAVLAVVLAGVGSASAALDVDFASTDSMRAAARDLAFDTMSYYRGNESGRIPGLMDHEPPRGEYYWWTNAIVWSTMLDYWRYTGDSSYNPVVVEALTAQNGPHIDFAYRPENFSLTVMNDDQCFWGLAAMQAAEQGLADPPEGEPGWVELAKRVFDMLAAQYAAEADDDETCRGGLRWHPVPGASGHEYKNVVSTAAFMNLGARLARYTGNETYDEWAERSWNWLTGVGLVDADYKVFDGGHTTNNCTDINKIQWTYTAGVLIQTAAHMYNHTTDTAQKSWQTRLQGLANATLSLHFLDGILTELACELSGACTSDMFFFKGITLRALGSAATLAPAALSGLALPDALRTTAEAAVATCDGEGADDDDRAGPRACGFSWATEPKAKLVGLPQQVNALSAVLSVLAGEGVGSGLATEADGVPGGGSGPQGGNGDGDEGGGDGSGNGSPLDESAGVSVRVGGMGLVVAGVAAAMLW